MKTWLVIVLLAVIIGGSSLGLHTYVGYRIAAHETTLIQQFNTLTQLSKGTDKMSKTFWDGYEKEPFAYYRPLKVADEVTRFNTDLDSYEVEPELLPIKKNLLKAGKAFARLIYLVAFSRNTLSDSRWATLQTTIAEADESANSAARAFMRRHKLSGRFYDTWKP